MNVDDQTQVHKDINSIPFLNTQGSTFKDVKNKERVRSEQHGVG